MLGDIRTLIDCREAPAHPVLPEELRIAYGGDLWFPPPGPERPYVIGNFVSTVDGVVTYQIAGQSGGGDISGFNDQDRFIMGLLRTSADAVMMGAGTFHDTAPEHLFIAARVYPEARDLYARYRLETLLKKEPPLHVVVSASGRLDLTRAIFRTPGIRTLIVTTKAGGDLLAAGGVVSLASTEVRMLEGPPIAPAAILKLLRGEFGVSLLLHEGGPTLFGKFVADGCVNELFLTVAPQIAGRNPPPPRPGFITGEGFTPETAPWLDLVGVKQRGSHLYLRYSAAANRPSPRLASPPLA
jgi:riboflavin biosynthesis pyrimidine reductase